MRMRMVREWVKWAVLPFVLPMFFFLVFLTWFGQLFTWSGRCAKCGMRLIETGYPNEGGRQRYKCGVCGR